MTLENHLMKKNIYNKMDTRKILFSQIILKYLLNFLILIQIIFLNLFLRKINGKYYRPTEIKKINFINLNIFCEICKNNKIN